MNFKNNNLYLILTPSGWSDFKGLTLVKSNSYINFLLDNELNLCCTLNHRLKLNNGLFKLAHLININDILYKDIKILLIQKIQDGLLKTFYDVSNVLLDSLYYSQGVISHNCGGDCIILSTPRGYGSIFHKLWVEALLGLNKFNTVKLPWYRHPLRDQAWRDKQTENVGLKLAAREYDCSFASSGETVLNDVIINLILVLMCINPILTHYHDMLWLFKKPLHNKNYIVSADVARGDGLDFSAFQVICILDDLQVALFKGKITTKDYGKLLVLWAIIYNNALLIVLNASIGWAVLQLILDLDYKNIYYHKKDFKYVDPLIHSKMRRTKTSDLQRDILGFSTTSKTRPLIVLKTMLLLLTKLFKIRSKRLINLLRTFIWQNGKAQAMKNYNDDLTMALCIGVWVRNTSYMLKKQASELTRKRLTYINSGANIRDRGSEPKVSSGFYSGTSIINDDNIINVGGENIDLNNFYFGNNKKDK